MNRPGRYRSAIAVSHVSPWPSGAGNELRMAALFRWLAAEGYRLHLLLTFDPDERQRAACAEVCAGVYGPRDWIEVPGTLANRWRLKRLAFERRRMLGRDARRRAEAAVPPAELEPMCTDALCSQALRLSATHPPDVVVAEYYFMTRLFASCGAGPVRVVDTHDAFALRCANGAGAGAPDPTAITRDQERFLLTRADVVLAIQPVEAEYFRTLVGDARVAVAGVDAPLAPEFSATGAPDGPVLVVASDNPANRRDTREWLERIWPRIRAAEPGARVRVVGRVAAAVPAGLPGVELAGWVPDLAAEYAGARVVVNPVRVGTGLKIKTIEALCHGKPLVSTPNGVEGLPADARPYAVAADEDGFVSAVCGLLGDVERRRALGTAARQFSELHFATERVYADLKRAIGRQPPRRERVW